MAVPFSGTNAYSGGTTVAGGTLVLASNNAVGTGSLLLAGGTLAGSRPGQRRHRGVRHDIGQPRRQRRTSSRRAGGTVLLSGNNSYGGGTTRQHWPAATGQQRGLADHRQPSRSTTRPLRTSAGC